MEYRFTSKKRKCKNYIKEDFTICFCGSSLDSKKLNESDRFLAAPIKSFPLLSSLMAFALYFNCLDKLVILDVLNDTKKIQIRS